MSGVKGQIGAPIGSGGDGADVFLDFISELDILVGDWVSAGIGDIGPNTEVGVQHPCRECKSDVEIMCSRYRIVLIQSEIKVDADLDSLMPPCIISRILTPPTITIDVARTGIVRSHVVCI